MQKAKGIKKWGPHSLFIIYIFSWISLVSGILVAFYFFMEKLLLAAFISFLIAITSWVSLNAFVYLATLIVEITNNTAKLKNS